MIVEVTAREPVLFVYRVVYADRVVVIGLSGSHRYSDLPKLDRTAISAAARSNAEGYQTGTSYPDYPLNSIEISVDSRIRAGRKQRPQTCQSRCGWHSEWTGVGS